MFDVHVMPGLNGCLDIKMGFAGPRGRPGDPALCAAVLMCQGAPEASLNLGPYSLPPGGVQEFTTGIAVCLVAPAADWIATLWRNSTLVGSATILAGETIGVVEFIDDGFTLTSPQMVNAICPLVADAAIQSPSITIA